MSPNRHSPYSNICYTSSMDIPKVPTQFETLNALPEALRENVLAYAARRLRQFELYKQRNPGIEGRVAGLAKDGKHTILTGADGAEVLRILTQAIDHQQPQIEKVVSKAKLLGEVNAAKTLIRDSSFAILLTDLNRHYGGPAPESMERLLNETLHTALEFKTNAPEAFKELSRKKIAPVIGEMPSSIAPAIEEMAANLTRTLKETNVTKEIIKETSYKKLAFAGVVGVLAGIITGKLFLGDKQQESPGAASR